MPSISVEKRIVIDVDIFGDVVEAVLIVCAPTGIFYSAQAGGMACEHPEAEGFAVPLFNPADDIVDEHAYGYCADIHGNREVQKQLADDIDRALQRETAGYIFKLRFDYDRLDELMEGWWPVIITGKLAHVEIWAGKRPLIMIMGDDLGEPLNHRAYLATGNCD